MRDEWLKGDIYLPDMPFDILTEEDIEVILKALLNYRLLKTVKGSKEDHRALKISRQMNKEHQ